MQNFNNILKDWRKHAAAMLNDEDVEVAFMRQAYTVIESKARPLLRDPYFIGFEVVDKNDANTNIVGLFVFRINKNLLYIPVFFKNGELKGAQLMYDANLKLFSPLSPSYCNYYVGKYQEETSSTVRNSFSTKSTGIDFDAMRLPSTMRKSASAESLEAWANMQLKAKDSSKLLPRLLQTEVGLEAFNKLAATADQSYDFANAMVESYSDDEWLDLDVGHRKTAHADVPETLVIHIGEFNNDAQDKDRQFNQGLSFTDTRKSKTEVICSDALESLTSTGYASVYGTDGKWHSVLVWADLETPDELYCDHTIESIPMGRYGSETADQAGYERQDSNKRTCYTLYNPDTKCVDRLFEKDLKGFYIPNHEPGTFETRLSELKVGDYVWAVEGKCALRMPIKLTKIKKEDGLTRLHFIEDTYSCEKILTINTELECAKLEVLAFTPEIKFFKIDPSTTYEFATEKEQKELARTRFQAGEPTADEILVGDERFSKLKIKSANDRFTLYLRGRSTFEFGQASAATKIACDLGVDGNAALDMLGQAKQNGSAEFLVKSARLFSADFPPAQVGAYDADLGTQVVSPESYVLGTTNDNAKPEASKPGDQYRMDGMHVTIETGTPEQLYEASKSLQDESLFDLGVVGSLVRTEGISDVVDKFIPDLRQGLDKLGRILFLIYWKPEEFVEAYGADDLTDMENSLLSTFKQFGELVLDLLQKFKFEDEVDMNSYRGTN